MRRLDACTERRLSDAIARSLRAPVRREVVGHGGAAVLFLGVALLLAVGAPASRELSIPLAAAFVVALALAGRVEFSAGSGYTVPTQVVAVPMLLLLPTPVVPLLTGLALVLSALIDVARGGSA